MVRDLTKDELEVFVKENRVCVVYLWGPQCSPCRLVTPIIERLAEDMEVPFAKVNTHENPDVAWDLSVWGLPSVVVFKDGEVAEKIVGAKSERVYREKIGEIIGAAGGR